MSQQYGGYNPDDPYRAGEAPAGEPYGGQLYSTPGTPPPGGYYGTNAYYQGYSAPQPTNTLAIVSLVTSILGLSIIGIVTGHVARGQIRRSGEGGAGIALAGLIIGYVVLVIEVAVILALVGVFVIAGSSSGGSF